MPTNRGSGSRGGATSADVDAQTNFIFHHDGQTGLERLSSGNLPTSASQSARITGVHFIQLVSSQCTGFVKKGCNTTKSQSAQKHLQWMTEGPDWSYSCLLIHICWKVDSEAKMNPPIHTEYLRSGGAMILIFIVLCARAVISLCVLSAVPGYMMVPPDSTVWAYRSLWMCMPHFMMELKVVSWMLQDSMPRREGWKSASGQRNRSLRMVVTWPTGSS
ncbi:hypothetical protein AAY473_028676 [Plecturocebus cupreus]